MTHDLFGRPVYDGGRAVQPALFDAEHWFRLGYLDARHQDREPASEHSNPAYLFGLEAGQRDLESGVNNPDRAFRQARTVGNVGG